jgi:glycosyltransferase involved in cell wall biosynthesis
LIYPVLCYEIFVLYKLFKKIDPNILHINNGGYPAALSARAAAVAGRLAKVPKIVMVINNMSVNYRHFFRWMDYPIDRIVVHAVNRFITGSVAASDSVKKILCLPSTKLVTIHNGISMRQATATMSATRDRLSLNRFDGVIFGVVALLIPRKGHHILLEAVLKLVSESRFKDMALKVLIEGDGPLKAQLLNFVASNGLSHWVTFVGNESNIVDFMSVLDVLILPSVQDEDFPNVILEAMSLGKPVIASRLAGTPEQIIDGVTGLLVEPRNVNQLADAIGFLTARDDVRTQMGLAALDRFDGQFTSSKSVNNYMDFYQQLTKEA